ncbi:MAG TPA: hypothetical protein VE954_21545 [Oligoflexus sp.]|uniref:hypothetical protein n=1 Tax=Oligoflexus sp. TaxID=1971216 RepID=UPI002D6A2D90|nr:hypothetical protein [Oligoflexus sp.]HYX35689.1 hypothetical protein [Oligoflexus sp.]
MAIKNRHTGSLLLSFAFLAACQGPQKSQDETVTRQEPALESAQGDASEGVVGPDEAFFAAYYLELVFRYSQENPSPTVEPGIGVTVAPATVSAFDYLANFTDRRLQLMAQSLFAHGDADRDGSFSESEFANLKLDPSLLGGGSDKVPHAFESALFARVAGHDELVQLDECVDFLRDIGPAVRTMLDRSSAQDQRRLLVKSWENVLGRYDTDQNGSLSLQEQRDLRKDRALLINRLTGE